MKRTIRTRQVIQAEARPRGHAHVMQRHSAGPIDRHSQGLALLITACRHRAAGRRAPNGRARLGDVPRNQPHALEGTAHAQWQNQRPLAGLPELHRGNAMVDQVRVLRIRPPTRRVLPMVENFIFLLPCAIPCPLVLPVSRSPTVVRAVPGWELIP